jgi:hypothetical protein
MVTVIVIKSEPFTDALVQRQAICGRVKIHVFIFQAPSQPFDEDIIRCPSFAVHADLNIIAF